MTDEINVRHKEEVDEIETVDKVNVNGLSIERVSAESERSVFLSVLCILTFICSGSFVFGYLFTTVFSGLNNSSVTLISLLVPKYSFNLGVFGLIAAGASLYGAIRMWNLEKIGFYIYAAGQIVLLILEFGVFTFICTAIFLVLYGINIKQLK